MKYILVMATVSALTGTPTVEVVGNDGVDRFKFYTQSECRVLEKVIENTSKLADAVCIGVMVD